MAGKPVGSARPPTIKPGHKLISPAQLLYIYILQEESTAAVLLLVEKRYLVPNFLMSLLGRFILWTSPISDSWLSPQVPLVSSTWP